MEIKTSITGQEFYDLRHSVGWKDAKVSQLETALKNSMTIVGIYEGSEIVAMGRIVGDYSFKALLSDIIVFPKYQGKGYGKLVVKKLIEITKEKMNVGDILCIEGSPTKGNLEFYLKCGFKHKPEIQDGIYLWLEK